MLPIENGPDCSRCHDPNERLIGLLLTDIPTDSLETTLSTDLREDLLWGAGTILVTIVIINIVMSRMVIRRVEGLTRSIQRFGEGHLDLRHPSDNEDEIGQLEAAFNQMGQRIENEVADNRALSNDLKQQNAKRGELLKRLITAQEDERKRVARELHDGLGQALGALALQTEIAERLIDKRPLEAIEQLNQIKAQVTETTDQMYDLILALRPSVLDDLGLEAAVRSHADRFLSGTGIAFELYVSNFYGHIDPEIETALYRIVQEALSNVVRHSQANHVRILLACHDSTLEAEIADDGQGFDLESVHMGGATTRGLGLLGMQERVSQHGGQMEIFADGGSGTTIRILFPVMETGIE
jgi:signal transduction histidine kinase